MSRPVAVELYNAFLNHPDCQLTPEHREKLKTNRGFSDEFIDGFKFRSCRPENINVLQALLAQYGPEACLKAKLYHSVDGNLVPEGMLLQDRELIFYLNQFGEAFHMRPHKLGLEGVNIQPFFAGTDDEHPTMTVLAESEFKAAASWQFGVPSVGIPGIGVFSSEHFDRLVKDLQDENIHELTICFDNEIKNDPTLPKYKDDPMKRWDTPFYAILMAEKLTTAGFFGKVKIAQLPDSWRIPAEGRIDIDGALAAGHTPEQYQTVIAGGISPEDYLKSLCPEAQKIVHKKFEAKRLSEWVRRAHNCYQVKKIDSEGKETWKPVSDFVFSFVTKTAADDNILREIEITHADGATDEDTSRISSAAMTTIPKFQEFLFNSRRGDCHFFGKPEDLLNVIKLEHTNGRDEVIIEPDHIGNLDCEDDVWLFGNGAWLNGKWTPVDRYGVSWNGTKGFRARQAVNSFKKIKKGKKGRIDRYLSNPIFDDCDKIDLKDLARRLFKNYGGAEHHGFEAVLAYTWSLAIPFANEIFERYEYFPIMYLLGEASSGKTRLAKWILAMHGIQAPGSNADASTAVNLERQASFFSCLPVLFDEMRNHGERNLTAKAKEALLRSIYDRTVDGKGLRTLGPEMRTVEPRGAIIVCGEHRPSDEALNTRCLMAVFKKINTKIYGSGAFGSEFSWFNSAKSTLLPKVLPKILRYGPAAEVVLNKIEEISTNLRSNRIGEPRTILNYALVLAAHLLLVDPDDGLGFCKWLVQHCSKVEETRTLDSCLERFLDDLPTMEAEGKIKRDIHFRTDAGVFALVFHKTYHLWMKEQPGFGEGLPNAASTRALFLQSKCCEAKTARVGSSNQRCLTFELSNPNCPPQLTGWLCPAIGKTPEKGTEKAF